LIVYWSLFAFFAIGAGLTTAQSSEKSRSSVLWALGILLIIIAVGLRYEVGADWHPYKRMFSFAGYSDLGRMFTFGDPGYQLLNWLVQRSGFGLWLVNLVCAIIFGWGLSRFARQQPSPWLTVLVAIPYLVVVVAMGYTRQGVAIGILMAGLAALQRGGSPVKFLLYAAAATLFHKTAVIAVPLVLLASQRNRLLNIVAGLAGAYILYDLFLAGSVDRFVRNYVDAEYSAQGAAIRVAMDIVAATLFFLFRKRLAFPPDEDLLWRNFALASFAALIMLQLMPSSVAVDRLALYLIPLQLAVLPRLGQILRGREIGTFLVIAYSFTVMFVWLNFAQHASDWLPYQFYPLS
jgi:hypothetical protein